VFVLVGYIVGVLVVIVVQPFGALIDSRDFRVPRGHRVALGAHVVQLHRRQRIFNNHVSVALELTTKTVQLLGRHQRAGCCVY
jgi:hypothetical protein|tara:strand:- start:1894 stop:2142 length:249 start_codon:yes stop_codon:yes gene_type:complete